MNIYQEKKISFRNLTEEVNKRLLSNYAINYVQSVHTGIFKSKKIKDCIDQILKEAE